MQPGEMLTYQPPDEHAFGVLLCLALPWLVVFLVILANHLYHKSQEETEPEEPDVKIINGGKPFKRTPLPKEEKEKVTYYLN